MPVIPCRATINLVGASAGSRVLVDPEDPKVALHIEKGYLVPDGDPVDPVVADEIVTDAVTEPVTEGGDGTSGESDADETLGADTAVGDDAELPLEPVGDADDESSLPAA